VELHNAWIGVCWFSDWACRRDPATLGNSTGILVNGNDQASSATSSCGLHTRACAWLGPPTSSTRCTPGVRTAARCPTPPASSSLRSSTASWSPTWTARLWCSTAPLALQGSGCSSRPSGQVLPRRRRPDRAAAPAAAPPPRPSAASPFETTCLMPARATHRWLCARSRATRACPPSTGVTVSGSKSWQPAASTRATLKMPPSQRAPLVRRYFSGLLLFNTSVAPIQDVSVSAVCVSGPCAAAFVAPPYALQAVGPVVPLLGADAGSVWALSSHG